MVSSSFFYQFYACFWHFCKTCIPKILPAQENQYLKSLAEDRTRKDRGLRRGRRKEQGMTESKAMSESGNLKLSHISMRLDVEFYLVYTRKISRSYNILWSRKSNDCALFFLLQFGFFVVQLISVGLPRHPVHFQ